MADIPPKSGKIFIGGLSYETTDERLRNYFETYGYVTDAVVMKDPITRRSRGFGFITYSDPLCVDRVLAQSTHILDNRRVEAKRAVPRAESNMIINHNNHNRNINNNKNTSLNTTTNTPDNSTSSSIQLNNYQMIQTPIANNNIIIDSNNNYKISVQVSNTNTNLNTNTNINTNINTNSNTNTSSHGSRKIFVGGLHYETKDAEFRRYFEKYGKIISAEVMFNRETNKSRGFGFVVFDDEKSVELVLKEKNHSIDAKAIEVKKAVPRTEVAMSPGVKSSTARNNSMMITPSETNGMVLYNSMNRSNSIPATPTTITTTNNIEDTSEMSDKFINIPMIPAAGYAAAVRYGGKTLPSSPLSISSEIDKIPPSTSITGINHIRSPANTVNTNFSPLLDPSNNNNHHLLEDKHGTLENFRLSDDSSPMIDLLKPKKYSYVSSNNTISSLKTTRKIDPEEIDDENKEMDSLVKETVQILSLQNDEDDYEENDTEENQSSISTPYTNHPFSIISPQITSTSIGLGNSAEKLSLGISPSRSPSIALLRSPTNEINANLWGPDVSNSSLDNQSYLPGTNPSFSQQNHPNFTYSSNYPTENKSSYHWNENKTNQIIEQTNSYQRNHESLWDGHHQPMSLPSSMYHGPTKGNIIYNRSQSDGDTLSSSVPSHHYPTNHHLSENYDPSTQYIPTLHPDKTFDPNLFQSPKQTNDTNDIDPLYTDLSTMDLPYSGEGTDNIPIDLTTDKLLTTRRNSAPVISRLRVGNDHLHNYGIESTIHKRSSPLHSRLKVAGIGFTTNNYNNNNIDTTMDIPIEKSLGYIDNNNNNSLNINPIEKRIISPIGTNKKENIITSYSLLTYPEFDRKI